METLRGEETQLESELNQQRHAAGQETASISDMEGQAKEMEERLKNLEKLSNMLQEATKTYDALLNDDPSSAAEPELDPELPLSQLIEYITRPPAPAKAGPPQRPPQPVTPVTHTAQPQNEEDIVTDLFWGNAVAQDPHLRSVSAPPIDPFAPSDGSGQKSGGPPRRPPPPKKAMTPQPGAGGSGFQMGGSDPFASAFPPAAKNDPFASSNPDPFKSSGPDPFSDDAFGAAFSSSSKPVSGFDDDDAWAVRK